MDRILLLEMLEDVPEINIVEQVVNLLQNDVHAADMGRIFIVDDNDAPVRNENYYENVVPLYSTDEFFEHFRMSRETMQALVNAVGNRVQRRARISLEKKILFTVWMLAKPESFLACSDRFGLSKGNGHLIFHEICQILCEMRQDEIKWPRQEQQLQIVTAFEQKTGFPGIVGAINGCHIPIKSPKNNPIDYYNRKSFHSIILQAVCDNNLLFTDIFVGMPGRVHDARVFRNSQLFQDMTNEENPLFPPDLHLLGDSAYPLLVNLLVPFKDNGHLSERQSKYNTTLSSARSKIEQAFGKLKGKFRRLKYLDMDIENIPTTVTAACVLHNFIIRRENVGCDYDSAEAEDLAGEEHIGQINEPEDNDAVAKRNGMVEYVNN